MLPGPASLSVSAGGSIYSSRERPQGSVPTVRVKWATDSDCCLSSQFLVERG